ncbi:DUF3489 domain-containing protein [Hyphomicrobium sp. DY-1]|uniref:DUF3489 domain-containing protein n=1 Tax=Hyphomicrobium sp. DY-1 TaxID=3075650 RepID=UPI0039C00E94
MTTVEVHSPTKAKRATQPSGGANKSKRGPEQSKPAAAPAGRPDVPARSTKQNRILSLLNQRYGATIPEMMLATDWQQHSVRGFLAGTVKKKLGLDLTSSKSDGELRRYRIAPRRGR